MRWLPSDVFWREPGGMVFFSLPWQRKAATCRFDFTVGGVVGYVQLLPAFEALPPFILPFQWFGQGK